MRQTAGNLGKAKVAPVKMLTDLRRVEVLAGGLFVGQIARLNGIHELEVLNPDFLHLRLNQRSSFRGSPQAHTVHGDLVDPVSCDPADRPSPEPGQQVVACYQRASAEDGSTLSENGVHVRSGAERRKD